MNRRQAITTGGKAIAAGLAALLLPLVSSKPRKKQLVMPITVDGYYRGCGKRCPCWRYAANKKKVDNIPAIIHCKSCDTKYKSCVSEKDIKRGDAIWT